MRDIVQRGYFVSEKQTITVISFFLQSESCKVYFCYSEFSCIKFFVYRVFAKHLRVFVYFEKSRIFVYICVFFSEK